MGDVCSALWIVDKTLEGGRWIHVVSSHLQNGKPARRKNPGKMGKRMENGPKAKMAKKWPNNGKKVHLSNLAAICGNFGLGAIFHLLSHFFRDFRVGQVSNSVNGRSHCNGKPQSQHVKAKPCPPRTIQSWKWQALWATTLVPDATCHLHCISQVARRCHQPITPKFVRSFEKGLAGGGWRLKGAKTQQNWSPQWCSPFPTGRIGKRAQKEVWMSGIGRIFSCQPPLPANPFSKLLNLGVCVCVKYQRARFSRLAWRYCAIMSAGTLR